MDNWFALIVGLGSTRCFMDIEQQIKDGIVSSVPVLKKLS